MDKFLQSILLILVLLNPFLVIIYLIDAVRTLTLRAFSRALLLAGLISAGIFSAFAIAGDAIFVKIAQVHFASFQIFGGITLLLIALQFVFKGPDTIEILRGDSQGLVGAITMPVLVGPGTLSASVLVGKRLLAYQAMLAIAIAVFLSILIMIGLKWLHDYVLPRQESIVERYVEVVGRITALYIGSVSIDLIMQGLTTWLFE
jgi:small neutral amino acid transporter SnatA (MarC family)